MTQQNPELRAGILRAFDAGTYKATVQFTGSLQQYVAGVNVTRDIAAGDMLAGATPRSLSSTPPTPATPCSLWCGRDVGDNDGSACITTLALESAARTPVTISLSPSLSSVSLRPSPELLSAL